ncbi:hypothetical protein ACJH6H_28335 [Mycobacterium sp. SMC-21]|uniref:hypothetical protein n=1 Tax=Mycobacteriaceae TaxID=1762 RepID=UPI00092AF49D|nr:hypothetical protein [Mycobacteroides abscessus]SIN15218.1 Uncharacterised protein [Mycobacteroides abscessus subsp. abscessus]SLE80227.1 Uncharacterised protein [Mycobacteroides abscessus subsp. abscessus]
MTAGTQSFTVTLADGNKLTFNNTETPQAYSIEANGVLVIVSRTDTTIETDRYSPTAWTCVSESRPHTGAQPAKIR